MSDATPVSPRPRSRRWWLAGAIVVAGGVAIAFIQLSDFFESWTRFPFYRAGRRGGAAAARCLADVSKRTALAQPIHRSCLRPRIAGRRLRRIIADDQVGRLAGRDRRAPLGVGESKGVRNLYPEALIFFFGPPRGRRVVCNPNDAAVFWTQRSPPKGRPWVMPTVGDEILRVFSIDALIAAGGDMSQKIAFCRSEGFLPESHKANARWAMRNTVSYVAGKVDTSQRQRLRRTGGVTGPVRHIFCHEEPRSLLISSAGNFAGTRSGRDLRTMPISGS